MFAPLFTHLVQLLCVLGLLGASVLTHAQSTAVSPPNVAQAPIAVASAPVATSPAQAAAAITAPSPDFGGNMLQLVLGLSVVLALMVGALWLIKQLTQRRGTASAMLKVVAGTAVGPRERVVIVEVGSTWLVLGVAPGRVTPLAEVPRQTNANAANAALAAERRPTATDFPQPGRAPGAGA
jgi:flagellar protein FliO/FliZ